MELSRISLGLYRPRIKRLSNSDLQSVHCVKSFYHSESESSIKLSRISSSAYKTRVTRVNKEDLPTAHHRRTLKPDGTPISRLSKISSFYYRHRIMPINHGDFESLHRAASFGSKTVRVSLSTRMK
jgi:hypothetical protein